MKKFLFALALTVSTFYFADAQMGNLDKSPMDATYLRYNRGEAPVAKVIYSRPQKNDRAIFGELVPFDKVWRTGANENTELKIYKEVSFGGKTLTPGTYSLFTIPGADKWVVIVNSVTDMWGSGNYAEENDVVRVEVPSQGTPDTVEAFTIAFDVKDKTAHMIMAWDNTMVSVPVE